MADTQKPWTKAEDELCASMAADGRSYCDIGEALGRTRKSVERRCARIGAKHPGIVKDVAAPVEEFRQEEDANGCVITSKSSTIRTLDDAVAEAKVDLTVWEVERHVINKWDQGSKIKGKDGVRVVELWQVKVWLKRKVPKHISDAAETIIDKMRKHAPKYPSIRPVKRLADPHLFYIGLHDHHFGKLCWAAETGDNYDLKIAEQLYEHAGEELVRKAQGFPIERFVLPLGHDFLHVDGYDNMTTNGTPQDVDGRFAKIFDVGQSAVIRLIDYLIGLAPVDVVWIPGNHDYLSSRMLAKTVEAWYRNCSRVTVDCSPRPRKRVHYGVNLIGCTHGYDEKAANLPGVMAQEWPREWSESKCREWLIGDKHKAKETHYNVSDTINGVTVRILPSLAGTDLWHYKKGFIGTSQKTAQGIAYSKSDGFVAQFNANF